MVILLLLLKIGYFLKKCVNIFWGYVLCVKDKVLEEDVDNFEKFIVLEWSYCVFYYFFNVFNMKKFNKVELLLFVDDFEKLRKSFFVKMFFNMECFE